MTTTKRTFRFGNDCLGNTPHAVTIEGTCYQDIYRSKDRFYCQELATWGRVEMGTDGELHFLPSRPVSSEELLGVTTADPDESFSGKRRTGLAAIVLVCGLFFSGVSHAADPATAQPKAPRAKPISTISVKVQPAAKMDGKLWRITTVDQDSCVAWVSTMAPNLEQAEMQAFRECRKAINVKVDDAADKAGV